MGGDGSEYGKRAIQSHGAVLLFTFIFITNSLILLIKIKQLELLCYFLQ